MKNKKGFISMTLVYTFLILFMFLMLAILRTYTEKDKFLTAINEQIDSDIGVAKGSRKTFINKLIEDNLPSSDKNIGYYKISNSFYGNGNGLFYMDQKSYDEYYNINGQTRTLNMNKITDENNDGTTGRIYYFRGNVENNHLIFADMCFRIIRTNEDGSIRIRYNGIPTNNKCPTLDDYDTNPNIGRIGNNTYNYNPSSNNTSAYVNPVSGEVPSFDYENTQSPIIELLNEWYKTHFIPQSEGAKNYTDYISKGTIFCNNKIPHSNSAFYLSKEIAPVFIDKTNMNIYNENNIKSIIRFRCENKNDRFSINDNNLLYPVGLVTAQDVALAGGYLFIEDEDQYNGGVNGVINNTDYYLYTKSAYWTMSPYDSTKVIYVDNNGVLKPSNVTEKYNIMPVISLNSNIIIASGKGTYDNPYKIK